MRVRVRTIPAYGSTYDSDGGVDRLASVRRLARWMDSEFEIPGTNVRFGFDPLIGLLLPGIGSVASSVVSLALISTMAKHGASGHLIVRMLLNVLIDTTVGSIPVLGNVFDVFFRANDRNVELLRRHYEEGRYQGSGWGLVLALGCGLVAICGLIVWVAVVLATKLWQLL